MSALHPEYAWGLGVVFLLWILFYWRFSSGFAVWIKKAWNLKVSKWGKLSHLLYLAGLGILLFSALDWRGRPQKIKGEVKSQKTLLLIDKSASMMAEDVRPSRFEKAIFLARHFVKKAAGHRIAVHLFSDTTKKVVPFTQDVDLIDARLSGLKELDILKGGTNLSVAIQESVQYFQSGTTYGNILVFTDSEETKASLDLDIPSTVSVAVVAIGTLKGAKIPVRDSRSNFRGYKNFQGAPVISKLDEDFLKDLESKIDHFRYWVASSYVLPTEEVLSFFTNTLNEKKSEDEVIVRPVFGQWILALGITLLTLGLALRFGAKAIIPASAWVFCVFYGPSELGAQVLPSAESQTKESMDQAELSEQTYKELDLLKKGKLSPEKKSELARRLLKEKQQESAELLYEESFRERKEIDETELLNLGTAKIKNKKFEDGLALYRRAEELAKKSSDPSTLLDTIRRNRLFALQQQRNHEQKQKEKQQQQQQSDEEKEGDSNKEDGEKKQQAKNESKNQKKQSGKGEGQKQKKEQQKKRMAKNQGQRPKSMQKKKIPALVKQLMDDDRSLQEKLLDTTTNTPQRGPTKDW